MIKPCIHNVFGSPLSIYEVKITLSCTGKLRWRILFKKVPNIWNFVFILFFQMDKAYWSISNYGQRWTILDNRRNFIDQTVKVWLIQFSYVSWHIIWKSGDSFRKFKMADQIWRSEYWRFNNMLMKKDFRILCKICNQHCLKTFFDCDR